MFAATDVFLFYVFFEAMLVPMYFLIGRFGGPRRQYAAVKFFLYSLLGGLIMLASLIGLYVVSGEQLGAGTFSWADLQRIAADVPESTQIWLFLGFFVAFAIKAPLVPFHTWLPDAGAEAPIGAGVLLVGVLDKVGTFGFLRYCLPLFPLASQRLAPLVLTLAVIGILYGALLAVGPDGHEAVRRLHLDRPLRVHRARASSPSPRRRWPASTLYMVNHGLSTGMLFVMVGMLIVRGGSRLIDDYGGVVEDRPAAGRLPAAGRAVLAGAARHQLVRQRVPGAGRLLPAGAGVHDPGHGRHHLRRALRAVVLPAHHAGPAARRRGARRPGARAGRGGPGTMLDPAVAAKRAGTGFPDLTGREIAVLTPLIVLIMVLGFVPGPVLDVITPVGGGHHERGGSAPTRSEGLIR